MRTDNVQPAITLVNLACMQMLREQGVAPSGPRRDHSLGVCRPCAQRASSRSPIRCGWFRPAAPPCRKPPSGTGGRDCGFPLGAGLTGGLRGSSERRTRRGGEPQFARPGGPDRHEGGLQRP